MRSPGCKLSFTDFIRREDCLGIGDERPEGDGDGVRGESEGLIAYKSDLLSDYSPVLTSSL